MDVRKRRLWGLKTGSHCPPTLALFQLDRPADLNAQVAVAQLPQQDQELPQGTQCLAMGWGRLGTREPLPNVLQELNVTVVTFLCRPHNVCTFVPRRKAGICFVRTHPVPSVPHHSRKAGGTSLGGGAEAGLQGLPRGGRVGSGLQVESPCSSLSSCRLCLGSLCLKRRHTHREGSVGDTWRSLSSQRHSGHTHVIPGAPQRSGDFLIPGSLSDSEEM